mmetsp:Transcript_3650/g.8742  ORF Transcript_3650/g.8742 Transcript_3650/m.8742 type:complete len:254 (+) Transcript_3650:1886-2647(+)
MGGWQRGRGRAPGHREDRLAHSGGQGRPHVAARRVLPRHEPAGPHAPQPAGPPDAARGDDAAATRPDEHRDHRPQAGPDEHPRLWAGGGARGRRLAPQGAPPAAGAGGSHHPALLPAALPAAETQPTEEGGRLCPLPRPPDSGAGRPVSLRRRGGASGDGARAPPAVAPRSAARRRSDGRAAPGSAEPPAAARRSRHVLGAHRPGHRSAGPPHPVRLRLPVPRVPASAVPQLSFENAPPVFHLPLLRLPSRDQ